MRGIFVWGVVVGRDIGLGWFGYIWTECFLGELKDKCKVVGVVNTGQSDERSRLGRCDTIDRSDQR